MKAFRIVFYSIFLFCCSNKILHESEKYVPISETNVIKKENCDFYFDSTLNNKVYLTYDSNPSFNGGEYQMSKYIIKHFYIDDPQDFVGTFKIELLIDNLGKILSAKILNKSPLTKDDSLMLSIFEGMPNWNPAICNSIPVYSKINIRIKF
jgi:hypothetical protein